MRGQTGEGVSHYVPVSETSKWSPPLSARCCSHSRRAGCRGCGAGVTTANRTRIWRAVAPARAINENAFASACVRCGQCVQACPYDTLKLATLASGLSAGTPYFVARDIPCEMCEDIPCAKVCPSGALIVRLNRSTTRGWGWRYWWTGGKLSQLSGAALRCLLSRMPEN